MMSESKLKQTLKTSLLNNEEKADGDIEKKQSAVENSDEFDQASKNTSKSPLSSEIETIKPGEQEVVEIAKKEKKAPVAIETAKKATDKSADKTVASRKIEKASTSEKPVKVPAVKQKSKRNYMGGATLVLPIIAILAVGYLIVDQKQSQAVFQESLDVINTDMNDLSLKSDDLAVSIIKVQDKVQLNTNNIAKFDTIQDYIVDLDKQIENKLEEIDIIKGRMDRHDKTLEAHGNELKKLGIKIKKYSVRRAPTKKATKKVAVKKVYDDPTKLKDAVVASIDSWGTQPYVMLRNDRGEWIPMAMGDYYKGWKLSGVMGDEAVFKKGRKIRKLAIEG
jgi:hypothetical protein